MSRTRTIPKENEILDRIKALRANGSYCNGTGSPKWMVPVKPVVFDCGLWRASWNHSQDMSNKKSGNHQNKDCSDEVMRAEAEIDYGDEPVTVTENIVQGSEIWMHTGKEAMDLWIASPNGPCQNLLDLDHKKVGVAYSLGDSSRWGDDYGSHPKWTAMFDNNDREADTSCATSSTFWKAGTIKSCTVAMVMKTVSGAM